jgi:ABC-type Fe3+ transport system permease subunit
MLYNVTGSDVCRSEADSAKECGDESRWANFRIGRVWFACCFFLFHVFIYIILTAIGLMPGGSVYKDKVHEHPQYNTVHIHKYNTNRLHEHYKTQETENTGKTHNT